MKIQKPLCKISLEVIYNSLYNMISILYRLYKVVFQSIQ